jgi:hypothetical protein
MCSSCENGTYSLTDPCSVSLSRLTQIEVCKKFPDGADACYGDVIVVKEGYWRVSDEASTVRDADDLVLCACLKMGLLTSCGDDSSFSYETLKPQAQTLMRRLSTRVKIDVSLWQIGSILPLALDLQFPDLYVLVASTLSVVDFSISKPSLISSSSGYDAIDALVMDTISPLILVTLMGIVFTLHNMAAASSDPIP